MPPEIETHLVNTVLTNGARYYVDHAHPEYSTPECVDALELVVADKAGERILARSMRAATPPARPRPGDRRLQEQLRRQGQQLRHARELPRRPRPCPSRTSCDVLLAVVREPPGVHRRRQGRQRERCRRRRLPDQPARRLLRGGGRPRDHAEAADRQHPRRAARRPAAVPAAARDRGRRQPLRGGDLPQGRDDRDRPRDDRGRRDRQGLRARGAGAGDADGLARPARAGRRSSWPTAAAALRSSSSGSSCASRASTPTRPASPCAAARRSGRWCSTAGSRCSPRSRPTRDASTASSTG